MNGRHHALSTFTLQTGDAAGSPAPSGVSSAQLLYTEAEACALLKVSRWTLRRLRQANAIGWLLIGSRIRYASDDLEEYIQTHSGGCGAWPGSRKLSVLRRR